MTNDTKRYTRDAISDAVNELKGTSISHTILCGMLQQLLDDQNRLINDIKATLPFIKHADNCSADDIRWAIEQEIKEVTGDE